MTSHADDLPAPGASGIARGHTPLAPVFLGLRLGLHTLVVLLVGFVLVRAIAQGGPLTSWIVALCLVLLASYASGAFVMRGGASVAAQRGWLALLSLEGLALVALTPDAAFLVFPLFFLQLHLLPRFWGPLTVLLSTALTIAALTLHSGWHVGGVLGPLIGAIVAIVLGLGYRALYRESQSRQLLIEELVSTREELARRQHDSGVLQERSRLAREIHDTVAQGLSSIQLLLHAAERDGASGTVLENVRLARETAAANLAETRHFIRELTPPPLEGQSLTAALSRLAEANTTEELTVTVHTSGQTFPLPMPIETALLRIAQGALANVRQHSQASRAEITLSWLDDWVGLDIVDNGRGFDPLLVEQLGGATASFGLIAMRQRVEKLGGSLTIETEPDAGTAIAVGFDVSEPSP